MTSPLFVDRLPAASVLAAQGAVAGLGLPSPLATSRDSTDRYWSTPPRPQSSAVQDVLQVRLGEPRLVNYVSVELAHFPHSVALEYQDEDTGAWAPFEVERGVPAGYSIGDSVPQRVDRASTRPGEHPQHHGPGHWVPTSWRVLPVATRLVRLVLQRAGTTGAPLDPAGNPVAYSLGARTLQVGYRINSRADVPRYGDVTTYQDDFSSSTDLLGSRVVYSLQEDAPRHAIEPAAGRVWRCDPQPVGYAVVCYYADLRGPDGDGQVVDRWFVDPTTVGVHCNLYWSDEEPGGSFPARDQPLGYPIVQQHGASPTPQQPPQQTNADRVAFGHTTPSYVDVDNEFLQFDPAGAWWLGVDLETPWYSADGDTGVVGADLHHPIVSLGANVLRLVPGALQFTTASGVVAQVPLDPLHLRGARWRATVAFNPEDTDDFLAGVTLTYQLGDLQPVQVTVAAPPQVQRPTVVRIGGYPDDGDPGLSGFSIRALVLKTTSATAADVATYMADPQAYVRRAPFEADDTGTTDDAILRMEPWRSDPATSPVGLFGGLCDCYAQMTWTPVARDYVLKRGYLHLPPTKARFWKFEFTGLVPEPYESFVPIRRQVSVFTTDTVARFAQMTAGSSSPADAGGGVATALALADVSRYGDAIGVLRGLPDTTRHTATEVLYSANPVEAERVARFGWVWGFQPWHIGSMAPRFTTTTRHVYETVTVDHRTRVAFFVGLRALQASRVDYLADDDTEQYLDHFDDLHWVESTDAMELVGGALVAASAVSQATSKTLGSAVAVRAVQLATQQSDAIQVLPDDSFEADALDPNWSVYGDARLTHLPGQVTVVRGWYARTYGGLETEAAFGTYSAMEGHLYAELEGAQSDGVAGGGVQSAPVAPSHGGRIYAAVRVSTQRPTTVPVVVQIVSTQGDVVLAQQGQMLVPGEEASFHVGYTPGSAHSTLTYGDMEALGTYGAIEGTSYESHESVAISGAVYVRAAQVLPSRDDFTVTRLGLFDDPILWSFSVDGGATWYDALDVKNDPQGVLTFPEHGRQLRWRVTAYAPGASVSALAIRPWYAGLLGAQPSGHGMDVVGPNTSPVDRYPPIQRDPMWQQWHQPIPSWWYGSLRSDTGSAAATGGTNPPPGPPPPPPPPPPPSGAVYGTTYGAVYPGAAPADPGTVYTATYEPTYRGA